MVAGMFPTTVKAGFVTFVSAIISYNPETLRAKVAEIRARFPHSTEHQTPKCALLQDSWASLRSNWTVISPRWTSYPTRTESQNTLVVNQQYQLWNFRQLNVASVSSLAKLAYFCKMTPPTSPSRSSGMHTNTTVAVNGPMARLTLEDKTMYVTSWMLRRALPSKCLSKRLLLANPPTAGPSPSFARSRPG
ncbi:glycoside hydrolase family 16 protein [Tulasnella calospora MUT 4182]|uniref:Glycoside hydrolase family 16 protein n=1 Tax=Tulasnella calospora MUT 4182 TaxID=1051891 RepID=A0A0C3PSA5_9AGAM|nr:glycoside hydrolase family 16 protein [Tulasnella calospora MUT 4182]